MNLRIVSVMARFCKQTAEFHSFRFLFTIGPRVYFLMLGGLTWLKPLKRPLYGFR